MAKPSTKNRKFVRLSDIDQVQRWVQQFDPIDRSLATSLVDRLTLVSEKDFVQWLELTLKEFVAKHKESVAVHPVSSKKRLEKILYNPFRGPGAAIKSAEESDHTAISQRRDFGSEDWVGRVLQDLEKGFDRSGEGRIVANPLLRQIKGERIRHLILVDDICGSGRRIVEFWRAIPKEIKSLLSYGKMQLWIVVYAASKSGIALIKKEIPRFPIESNLICKVSADPRNVLSTPAVMSLCKRYAARLDREEDALGYRASSATVVFEHSCPNNVPVILRESIRSWRPLFPGRVVPSELHQAFSSNTAEKPAEELWRAAQPTLALRLLDALEGLVPLCQNDWNVIAFLGLRSQNVSLANVGIRLGESSSTIKGFRQRAIDMGMYSAIDDKLTELGRECLSRVKMSRKNPDKWVDFGNEWETYYPLQCAGEPRGFGIPAKLAGHET